MTFDIQKKIKNKKNRILITGGSGFIGVNLIFYLLKQTNNIVLSVHTEVVVSRIVV